MAVFLVKNDANASIYYIHLYSLSKSEVLPINFSITVRTEFKRSFSWN